MVLPTQMRAAVLTGFDDPKTQLVLRTIPIPELKPGEVLVRMAAVPINPSDLVFLRNLYGVRKKPPVVPGFEGSGTVVQSQAGFYGQWLLGKKVACRAPESGDGTWAEYTAAPAGGCIPLRSRVTLEQGATLIVNPLTAWTLIDRARRERHRAVVQTAAASALGRMIGRLARHQRLSMIHLVRRPEQAALLKAEGAEHVLDTSVENFDAELRDLSRQLGATLLLDAVGGSLSSRVAAALPPHSKIVVYGALSGEAFAIPSSSLIFEGKTVSGFWLSKWIKSQGLFARLGMIRQVQNLLGDVLQTTIQARFPLEEIHAAIELYKKNRTEGKVLLTL